MDGGVGRGGSQLLPLFWRIVRSTTSFAEPVPLVSTATTVTVSPCLTLEIPASPPFTEVPESTVNVADVPSPLLTVRDQLLPEVFVIEETVPVLSSIVS